MTTDKHNIRQALFIHKYADFACFCKNVLNLQLTSQQIQMFEALQKVDGANQMICGSKVVGKTAFKKAYAAWQRSRGEDVLEL